MKMRELAFSLRANGFIENPHTLKWEKNGVNSSNGELPTTYMSEGKYRYNMYVRKTRED